MITHIYVWLFSKINGDPSWPHVELEATYIVETITLSNDDEITSGRFIGQGAVGLHLLKILFEIFQNSREPNLLFWTLSRTVCVPASSILPRSSCTDCGQFCYTVLSDRNGCRGYGKVWYYQIQTWTKTSYFFFLFKSETNFYMPDRTHSKIRRYCSGSSNFEECSERTFHDERPKGILTSLCVSIDCSMKWEIGGCFWFVVNFDSVRWEVPERVLRSIGRTLFTVGAEEV